MVDEIDAYDGGGLKTVDETQEELQPVRHASGEETTEGVEEALNQL